MIGLTNVSYRIQELSLGGILDQAIRLVKDHFGLLFGIVALVDIPFNLPAGVYLSNALPANPGTLAPPEAQMILQQEAAKLLPITLTTSLETFLLIIPLYNAAIIDAVAKLHSGQPTSVSGANSAFDDLPLSTGSAGFLLASPYPVAQNVRWLLK